MGWAMLPQAIERSNWIGLEGCGYRTKCGKYWYPGVNGQKIFHSTYWLQFEDAESSLSGLSCNHFFSGTSSEVITDWSSHKPKVWNMW